ncbi:hypothetical protein LJ739_03505 [Aestuariibacter halophilus]|uniref:Uncharacterized protein n=1 Tax=Fluctibacter halophilus TaxID=226011 RepID=A0ABS8G414_9ALTE|nr:hypothetical protein [Aestuariibacter halophilus]MCC2615305.1 hypothetical protein [Aestuariibacter halophilus]
MTVVIILAVLFAALFIVIPLIERSKLRISAEDSAKISRWILPLVAILLVVQLLRHVF